MKPTKEQPQQLPVSPPHSDQPVANDLPKLPRDYDPIAHAMEEHPGLTREKAEEMAEAFGF